MQHEGMRRYRIECVDPAEDAPCLLGIFDTRQKARQELRQEWERWQSLTLQRGFCHLISILHTDHFMVRTPSDKTIIYRVESDSSTHKQDPAE
jgi:hypothetical protein